MGFVQAPGRRRRFGEGLIDARVLGPETTAGELEGLLAELESGAIGPNDTLVLYLETHWLGDVPGGVLVGADAKAGAPPAPSVGAGRVGEVLGSLAAEGCRVILVLDVSHAGVEEGRRRGVVDWIRGLYRDHGVVVVVASKDGEPGRRPANLRLGLFAQAVVDSFDVTAARGARFDPSKPVTLNEWVGRVREQVEATSGGRQFADYYVPETGGAQRALIFEPRVLPATELAGGGR